MRFKFYLCPRFKIGTVCQDAMVCGTDEKHMSITAFLLMTVDCRAVKSSRDYVMFSLTAFKYHDWTSRTAG